MFFGSTKGIFSAYLCGGIRWKSATFSVAMALSPYFLGPPRPIKDYRYEPPTSGL